VVEDLRQVGPRAHPGETDDVVIAADEIVSEKDVPAAAVETVLVSMRRLREKNIDVLLLPSFAVPWFFSKQKQIHEPSPIKTRWASSFSC